jgi:hypothetical protein
MVHQGMLGGFAKGFKGVTLLERSHPVCFVAVAEHTNVLFVNSSIEDIQGAPGSRPMVALCTLDASTVTLRSSRIASNQAGGLAALNSSSLTLDACVVANNTVAGNGAGVFVGGTAAALITGRSKVLGNRAVGYPGGGSAVLYNGSLMVSGKSVIANNSAAGAPGGGVALLQHASFRLDGESVVEGNIGSGCGGIFVNDQASLLIDEHSKVVGNAAYSTSHGGGILSARNTTVVIAGSSVVALNKGGVAAFGASRVSINDSSIENNTAAFYGAGLSVGEYAAAVVAGRSRICGNVAENFPGGGVAAAQSGRVVVTGQSVICENVAVNASGGGVAVVQQSVFFLTDKSVVANNTSTGTAGGGGVWVTDTGTLVVDGGSSVLHNAARNGTGGGICAQDNATVTVAGGSTVAKNTGVRGGGGLSVAAYASLSVTGNSIIQGNMCASGFGGGLFVTNDGTADITDGSAFVANGLVPMYAQNFSALGLTDTLTGQLGTDAAVAVRARLNMDASVRGDNGPLTVCSSTIFRMLDECSAGMFMHLMACQCCQPDTFSFSSNISAQQCLVCPAFAKCPGGDVVRPVAGYWHSSPRSIQMHACPLSAACGDGGVCQQGYRGSLCASCVTPGYGMTLPFRCGRCMSPGRELGVYTLLSCMTVLLLTVTVLATCHDNLQCSRTVRPSDLIKVLVQFLQYLVILSSIVAPWPSVLKALFAACAVVFGAASGQVLSVDCWVSEYAPNANIPLSVQRQLASFIAPVGLACCVVLLLLLGNLVAASCRRAGLLRGCCRTRQSRVAPSSRRVLRQVPVIVIVVLYYSYPTLLRAALGFFSCVRIDDASAGPYAESAVLNHTAGYWMYNTSQECFTGWHKVWALALGLPAVLLLCVGVPVGLLCLLLCNRTRTADPAFQESFGFLYRNYRDDRVWWEAVWATQTILLTAIAVFQYTIKAFYSVVLLSVVMQAVGRPWAETRLHRLQLTGSVCLFLTSYFTLTLFTVYGYEPVPGSVPVHHAVVGVLLVVLNSAFVLLCLALIVAAFAGRSATLAAAVHRYVSRYFGSSRYLRSSGRSSSAGLTGLFGQHLAVSILPSHPSGPSTSPKGQTH